MDYLEEGRAIWTRFVPKSGQAGTVQGELLRAVEKLRDEAMRNGNGNWDAGFEILRAYLERHLLDEAVFPAEVISRSRETLRRLADRRRPLLEDGPYDELGDRVVDYYRHYGSRPHAKNAELRR
jgi:hypothetical protein